MTNTIKSLLKFFLGFLSGLENLKNFILLSFTPDSSGCIDVDLNKDGIVNSLDLSNLIYNLHKGSQQNI